MSLAIDVAATFTAGEARFEVEVALTVETGETAVVLGPSGSGKSLLLETVAGFHPHEGTVRHDGRNLAGVPPEERNFGFVFQDYALFPHMTVRENVAFGARYHDRTLDPDDLLASLGVDDLAERSPRTLSGGEKQRVALARALAIRPAALLLDEPLAALDVPTRQALREDLADVLADATAVYVTHNRTTARALADRVAVVSEGRLLQVGTPETVFESPASPFVARFVGANCLPARVLPGATAPGVSEVAVRPEHVELDPPDPDFEASVARVVREDAASRVTLSLDGVSLDAFSRNPPAPGTSVGVAVPPDRLTRFDADGTRFPDGDE